jgi:hypothetical protein
MAKRTGGPTRGWTRERVLHARLLREVNGLPINHAAVLRQDRGLHQAALRIFGRWPELLRAAGLDPAKVSAHRQWSREKVISQLRARYASGQHMHALAIQEEDPTLYSAATGFHSRQFHRRCPTWTREAIIARLQSIQASGGKLNHTTFRRDSMSRATKVLFGGWDAALDAAGIDPGKARKFRRPWTKTTFVAALREKHKARDPLNAKDARPVSLRRAANRLYGSWDRALRAAGLDPATIKWRGVNGVWYGKRPSRTYGRARR